MRSLAFCNQVTFIDELIACVGREGEGYTGVQHRGVAYPQCELGSSGLVVDDEVPLCFVHVLSNGYVRKLRNVCICCGHVQVCTQLSFVHICVQRVYMHVYVCVHAYVHACVRVCTCMCTCVCTCVCTCELVGKVKDCAHTCMVKMLDVKPNSHTQ